MAEAERWKAYTQRQGQLLPAFVEEALERSDPVFFIPVVPPVPCVAFACRGGFADRVMTSARRPCR